MSGAGRSVDWNAGLNLISDGLFLFQSVEISRFNLPKVFTNNSSSVSPNH